MWAIAATVGWARRIWVWQMDSPQVILSGFADESAEGSVAAEQFAVFAALGLHYYTIRFVDAGRGTKNIMDLSRAEIQRTRHLQDAYGLNVSSLGSPLGKIKLVDIHDGSDNRFVEFKKYLAKDVPRACELAHAFETKLIRGFSFYPPLGSDPREFLPMAVDRLGQIAELCHRSDLTFGLEVEANLVGCNGALLTEIHRQINHPALVLVFDAANILVQGYSPGEVFQQYTAMRGGIGWLHVKDCVWYGDGKSGGPPADHNGGGALDRFVPAQLGGCGYERILADFREHIPALERKLRRRGIPGVFLDLEPHLKGSGQFGGFSGPDGFGVALRSLCRVLDYVGIDYRLREFADVRAARGLAPEGP
jgi:sugar phosphate isomerase/epimerase